VLALPLPLDEKPDPEPELAVASVFAVQPALKAQTTIHEIPRAFMGGQYARFLNKCSSEARKSAWGKPPPSQPFVLREQHSASPGRSRPSRSQANPGTVGHSRGTESRRGLRSNPKISWNYGAEGRNRTTDTRILSPSANRGQVPGNMSGQAGVPRRPQRRCNRCLTCHRSQEPRCINSELPPPILQDTRSRVIAGYGCVGNRPATGAAWSSTCSVE
jgi:hypothetical protein